MFILLFFFLLIFSSHSKILYNIYKDNIYPINSDDYILIKSSQIFNNEILDLSKEKILERYSTTRNYAGFIFNKEDNLKYVLKRRYPTSNTFGLLSQNINYTFYEMSPQYIKYFGFEERTNCLPTNKCFFKTNVPEEALDLCQNITRCIGYYNNCLIENSGIIKCNEDNSTIFFQKKYRHEIFITISQNKIPFIGASIFIFLIHFVFIYKFY